MVDFDVWLVTSAFGSRVAVVIGITSVCCVVGHSESSESSRRCLCPRAYGIGVFQRTCQHKDA